MSQTEPDEPQPPQIPDPPDPPDPPDTRAARVEAAVTGWQRQLVDIGGRNTLLWYRDLRLGTLDVTVAHPSGLSRLMAGRTCRLSDLFREEAVLEDARARARALRAKAVELAEERGIATSFLAIGMATWQVAKAPRPPSAPVLLRPCILSPLGAAQDDFTIDLDDEAELNPVLMHYLRVERGLDLDPEAIEDLATETGSFNPYPVYAALERAAKALPGFSIAPRMVIGTFSYPKLPMVVDLAGQLELLANHDLVAALAGDPEALAAVRTTLPATDPDPDPGHEHLVLDADTSQRAVIDAVRVGSNLVVSGPPGTGKSQTIANLIATLAADGKSVLFVAQKRAAIDAVTSRLTQVGLDGLVLDLHDGVTNRRRLAADLGATLEKALATGEPGDGAIVRRLKDKRDELAQHAHALHEKRRPWGVSIDEVHQATCALTARDPAPSSRVRLSRVALTSLRRERILDLGTELRDAVASGAWTDEADADPWYGARLASEADVEAAREVIDGLAGGRLLATAATIKAILAASSVHDADSVATWHRALSTMAGVQATLEVFRPDVFDVPLDEHVAATAPRGDHSETPGIDLGWFARWRVRSQTRRLLRPGRPPRDLYGELLKARRERNDWTALTGAGGRPEISPRLDVATAALDSIRAGLLWLDERLPRLPGGGGLFDLPAEDLQERVDALAARPERLAIRPQVTRAFDGFAAVGLGDLVEDLASRRVAPAEVVAELDYVWWASLAQELANSDTRYAHHNGPALHRVAEAYREADRGYLDQSAGRVRAAVAQRLRETLADHPEHEAMVRAEAAKSRRHRSIRELMPVVGDTLTAIKPCWVMSPLVVASVLPPGRWFDVVVFDEASQVQPAEAMSAISRGSHVVVAGDNRQLPPTSFFTSVVDEEPAPLGEGSLTEGVESILDALAAIVPTRRLTWHYRSRDERLIAFANATMYDGSLVTFPSTGSDAVVTLESVEGTALLDAGDDAVIETTTSEVERVVALVLEHARTRPGESLGVIALGITHATRIEEALRDALRGAEDVAGFFAQTRPERFFVKNLERVQGDERDAVIVSIGFGKTLHGRVLHRFGPLNLEGGERRLNVAITRARQRLTVVSALRAEDLDPTRLRSAGALMLRDFLAYAASGGDRSADSAAVAPLAHELAERLRAHGAVVHEGYGHGSQRVDLAVEDGMAPGRMRVAVELDGPAYAQIPGVRDRERLRPQHLERLGWTHLRVWGTDVFRDPARDVARVIAAARVTVPDGAPTRSAAATTENATEAGDGTMHSADPEPTAAQVEAYVSQVGAAEVGATEVGATEGGDSAEVPAAEAESAQDVPAEPDDTVDAEPEPDDTVDAEPVPTVPAGAEPEPSARALGRSDDDKDSVGGEHPREDSAHDRWLQEQRPPHWE